MLIGTKSPSCSRFLLKSLQRTTSVGLFGFGQPLPKLVYDRLWSMGQAVWPIWHWMFVVGNFKEGSFSQQVVQLSRVVFLNTFSSRTLREDWHDRIWGGSS
jgi:hypothetical protein